MAHLNLDKVCLQFIDKNNNMLIPWYIMASYAYYEEDSPILTDALFDRLAKKILNNWDDIDHQHKNYLNEDMLRAGTYSGEYPTRVSGAVSHLRDIYEKANKKEPKKEKASLIGII